MINIAVEGESDREVAKAVIRAAGGEPGKVFVAGGVTRLDPKIAGYNRAAMGAPWVVFRDSDGSCPVQLVDELTARISPLSPRFRLRIAHSMSESWLLADRQGFAAYFSVPVARVPPLPETVPHAKRKVLELCATSRSRTIKNRMTTGRAGETGPEYVVTLNDFAQKHWDVTSAAQNSPSLARAIARIREIA